MKKTILLFFIPILGLAQLGTGLEIDDEGYAEIPLKPRNVAYQGVSQETARVSLKDYVPAIQHQNDAGTCVGWSSAYYAQTISLAKERNLDGMEAITDVAFSPLYLYRSAKQAEDLACKSGLGIPTALVTMQEQGSVRFNDFPYKCANKIHDSIKQKVTRYRLKEFHKLFGVNEDAPTRVRQTRAALAEGRPVVMGMTVQNSFLDPVNVYEPDTLAPYGNHAMAVIGYDDEKFEDGAFEIVNSWGKSWGNDGFMWIRYADYAKAVHYGFELIFEEEPEENVVVKNELSAKLNLMSYGLPFEVKQKQEESAAMAYQTTVYEEAGAGVADYLTKKEHNIGTRYSIKANINQPAYIYIFGADVKRPVTRLFPENDSISSYISQANATVRLPYNQKENSIGSFKLNTNDITSDYTIAIVSLEELDMQAIKEQVDGMEGPIMNRFYTALKDKLIARETMTLYTDTMGFDATFEEGTAAIMALDIRRSDYEEPSNE